MKIEYKVSEKSVNVRLIGELDTPATEEIQNEVEKILKHADKEITIDCSRLEYIASSGLRQLITIYKNCKNEGGHMTLTNVTSDVMEVLDDTTFSRVFDIV